MEWAKRHLHRSGHLLLLISCDELTILIAVQCEAELTRLQRQHKRYAATVVQVANLRNAITEYWNLLGYTSDQRNYFTAMMTTPDSALSYRVFRAHEREVERLRKQLSTKKILCQVRLQTTWIVRLPKAAGVLTVYRQTRGNSTSSCGVRPMRRVGIYHQDLRK